MMFSTSRPVGRASIQRFCYGHKRHTPAGEPLQQGAQILNAPGEPIQLGDDDGLDLFAVHQCKQPVHAGALQALCRLATVHDDLYRLGVVARP
jgi:hypothetical protein